MSKFGIFFIVCLLSVPVCGNYYTCNKTDSKDCLTYKSRTSFNFIVEPSVSVGSVHQFWTNTGLRYVVQCN